MANYSNLKAAIEAAIKTNGNQEITGQVLQDVLTSMVSVIGADYTFAGVATPATNPSTPDQNVVYMASQAGTYTNFGNIELPAGISLLMWNGAWTAQTFFVLDDVPTTGSNNLVKSGGVRKYVNTLSVPYNPSFIELNKEDGKFINDSGIIAGATSAYHICRFQISGNTERFYFIPIGANGHPLLVKYTDSSYSTVDTFIIRYANQYYEQVVTLTSGYYAISWNGNNVTPTLIPINIYSEKLIDKFEKECIYDNSSLIYTLKEDGKYINDNGEIVSAISTYHICKFKISGQKRKYYYYSLPTNGHPSLAKYSDENYTTLDVIINPISDNYGTYVELESGYYCMSWQSSGNTNNYLLPMNPYYDNVISKTIVENNIPSSYFSNPSDSLPYYDTEGNAVQNSNRYRTSLLSVNVGDKIILNGISNSTTLNVLTAFDSLQNVVIDASVAGNGYAASTYKEYIVPSGVSYIQLCGIWVSDRYAYILNQANRLVIVESELNTLKNKDFNKIISINDFTLNGSATRIGKNINISNGDSNNVEVLNSSSLYHWKAGIRFITATDCNIKFGKGNNYVNVVKGTSSTSVSAYYEGTLISTVTSSIDIINNKEYGVVLEFNVLDNGNGTLQVKLVDYLGNIYEHTFSIYSTNGNFNVSANSQVTLTGFSVSIDNFYDVRNIKVAILGDSYIQGHSMGVGRINTYANLLANNIGVEKCINFGLGGSNLSATIDRGKYDLQFAQCANYIIVPMSCNERAASIDAQIGKIIEIIHDIESYNIIPILGTFIELPTGYPLSIMPDINEWIRNSGYYYIDFDTVLRDVNGNVDSSLFLSDNTHPNEAGHQRLYNRILLDCPFLMKD